VEATGAEKPAGFFREEAGAQGHRTKAREPVSAFTGLWPHGDPPRLCRILEGG
jgi:hypothetical protein